MAYFPSVAFLTGSVGTGEWIVLFVVILIVVGPKRLPEIARKIGRTMEMFRRAADEFKDQLMNMDQTPPVAVSPPKTSAPAQPSSESDPSQPTDSYDNFYPDSSDYPGNESYAQNGPADQSPNAPEADLPLTGDTGEKTSEGGT